MSERYRHETWSSRTAFLLATIGAAVGLGNLWRFPYIAGENGGGAFVLIYLAFVFLLGLPLMAAEMMIGRRGHQSAVATMRHMVREENARPIWKLIGWLSLLVPFVGLSYYAVVAAWTLDYLWLAGIDAFRGFDGDLAETTFATRIGHPARQALLHGLFMAMTVAIVARGVNAGIARYSRLLMPVLFGMLLLLVVYGIIEGDFAEGLAFLFAPDFSRMTPGAALMALGQALFSLAVGVGMLITYSAYMPREFSLGESAAVVCTGDTIVAMLAGLAIFPVVFASGLSPAGGPGLIFMTLPVAFGDMPGGHFAGIVFFFLLFFAAFTTALGMLEPVVSYLIERPGASRARMTVLTGAATWFLGLLSVFSFNILADVHPLGWLAIEKTFFDIIDYTIANIMLPVNALLIALFAGWAVRRVSSEEELGATGPMYAWWRVALRYIAPVAILLVIVDLVF